MVNPSILSLFTCFLSVTIVFGQFINVTVDDGSSSITYSPQSAWGTTAQTALDFPFSASSSHRLVDTLLPGHGGAYASFEFTGVAVYFLSPKWPYSVSTLVSLDGGLGRCVDLFDPSGVRDAVGSETAPSTVVWSETGLTNTRHTVRVSACSGDQYAVVDGFIYSVPDPDFSSSSSSTDSRATASITVTHTATASGLGPAASSAASVTKKTQTLPIALAASLGSLAVLFAALIIWFLCRRQNQRHVENRVDLSAGTSYAQVPNPAFLASPSVVESGHGSVNSKYYTDSSYSSQMRQYGLQSHPASFYSSIPSSDVRRPQLPEL